GPGGGAGGWLGGRGGGGGGGERTPRVVLVRVVAEQVAVLAQRPGDIGATVERLADHEERSLDVVLVEDPGDTQRVRVVGTVVEGDRDLADVAGAVGDLRPEPRRRG